MAGGGGGGGGKGGDGGGKGKDDDPTGGGGGGCITTERQTELVLFQNLPTPSIRQPNWLVPTFPNPWSGSSQSATSLYDNPNLKYYCRITVATTCQAYGEAGIKSFIWNSQTNNNTMKIMVPENLQFKISIEYYEPCVSYWIGSNPYGRGVWYSEQTINYQNLISITQWLFIRKENC